MARHAHRGAPVTTLGASTLLHVAWRPPRLNTRQTERLVRELAIPVVAEDDGSALTSIVTEDYGGAGGSTGWNLKPTMYIGPSYDPYIPQYNDLEPVRWGLYTETDDSVEAIIEASLRISTPQSTLLYATPGAASLRSNV